MCDVTSAIIPSQVFACLCSYLSSFSRKNFARLFKGRARKGGRVHSQATQEKKAEEPRPKYRGRQKKAKLKLQCTTNYSRPFSTYSPSTPTPLHPPPLSPELTLIVFNHFPPDQNTVRRQRRQNQNSCTTNCSRPFSKHIPLTHSSFAILCIFKN